MVDVSEPRIVSYDGLGAPIYAHQVSAEPLITARDCELAGFDLHDVLEAAKGNAW
jgi:hypothetical protein